ncbi:type VII toxin-antitoxin system MntA family adenylyltransferase antitoxin [Thalassolituus marinus]|uniref:Nucleotidyltransferase domain-containing protein n=1 Tax=Thalassolituus marinus TaxID=671053 RepID=A0ABS7ZLE7_9GAMM|nr:nucleotidyltransferase domain-containing protein [Thalassolituus marinus]MCA6062541.1 nucleotidyltransferase domain-containing protein [Thalassolituus marinus]
MIRASVVVQFLQQNLPGLLAVYGFGSRVQGVADAQSDLDVAVLVEGYADPLQLWQLSSDLADIAGCPVDLLDLRAASTVMQHQIVSTGERWWASDVQAGLFEAFILSEKMALDERRALQLQDIRQAGRVYGE